jgi:hypothetical protein
MADKNSNRAENNFSRKIESVWRLCFAYLDLYPPALLLVIYLILTNTADELLELLSNKTKERLGGKDFGNMSSKRRDKKQVINMKAAIAS